MIDLLIQNSLLLLFFVSAAGYFLGRIPVFGIRLGSAAVLFIGLFVGALDPQLDIPLLVPQLGLVLFVYALGLKNGPNFFRSFQEEGNLSLRFILFSLAFTAALFVGGYFVAQITPFELAGLYAGSVTNTAALAGVLDLINANQSASQTGTPLAEAVIGYSLGYPIGVLGRILILTLAMRWWQIDFQKEAYEMRHVYPVQEEIVSRALRITSAEIEGRPLRELRRLHGIDLVFGRLVRNGQMSLSNGDTELEHGDILVVAGEVSTVVEVQALFGENAGDDVLNNYGDYTRRRVFVSNPTVVGRTAATLDLKEKYGAVITRVQRGDTDILANNQTVLRLGDRVRVMSRKQDIPALTELFGDSYSDASRVNLLSMSMGITIGLLLGMIQISLTDTIGFQVGFAGGTLIVALVLGALQRTGPIVWTLPYSSTETLQQIGLSLLLAGIGVRSGSSLENVVADFDLLILLGISIVGVLVSMVVSVVVGYKWLKIPFGIVSGMVASQPAVLGYLNEKIGNDHPNIGFALAMPVGIIAKVVFAQLMVSVLIN